MERVGVLVICYGSRAACMVEAFSQSSYDVDLYIVDKQRNPYNIKKAKEHVVASDLSIEKILSFAKKHAPKISLGICDSEGPIIKGVRDVVEKETGIPMVCPVKEYALEESKVRQRMILAECCPEANPRFKVYRKKDYSSEDEMRKDLKEWLQELDYKAVVKPDLPGFGKGVGVWGDHFNSFEELYTHFMSIYNTDSVIVEEKIDGEESSLQCLCDGRKIICLPDVRDYKRAFDGDLGPNTGGMGSYKSSGDYLPYMSQKDRELEEETANKIFKHLHRGYEADGLRGIAFYFAYMHCRDGVKILEINSRGGDPELINILPLLKDDFIDVCFDMVDGCLKRVRVDKKASVVTYKVPPTYGGFDKQFPEKVDVSRIKTPVDLSKAYKLAEELGGCLRIYPGSLQAEEDGRCYALGSRTVASLGIADTIEEAREISLRGLYNISGGALWYRTDVASREHIEKSIKHIHFIRKSEASGK